MNGEMHQICMLVNAARNSLKRQSQINVEKGEYVECVEFKFLPEKKFFHSKSYVAHSIDDWFSHCTEEQLVDVKMLCPCMVDNRNILGFANTGGSSIITFYSDARVTYWTAYWEFMPDKKKWMVSYTENEWEDAPTEKMVFENPAECFHEILGKIADFAYKINFPGFSDIFRKAMRLLDGTEEIPMEYPNGRKASFPELPIEKKRLFCAASTADVFGAMGSWNDSPPYYAQEMRLEEQYHQLSDELLKQIRLAVLYAINED